MTQMQVARNGEGADHRLRLLHRDRQITLHLSQFGMLSECPRLTKTEFDSTYGADAMRSSYARDSAPSTFPDNLHCLISTWVTRRPAVYLASASRLRVTVAEVGATSSCWFAPGVRTACSGRIWR